MLLNIFFFSSKPKKENQAVSPIPFSHHYAFSGALDAASTMESHNEVHIIAYTYLKVGMDWI